MPKNRQERREEIAMATLELAAETSIREITTEAIAKRVGIAQPTVFRHFKNRDEVFLEAIRHVGKGLIARLGPVLSEPSPSDQKLRGLLEIQLGYIADHPGLPQLLFSDRLHIGNPELKEAVRKQMQGFTNRITAIVSEGVESGVFRKDCDEEQAAIMIVALIQGLLMRWSLWNFEFGLEKQVEPLWQMIWASLKP